MKCINKTNGQTLADRLEMKDTYFGRLKGLLGVRRLERGQGIVLKPCTQIHTFFMQIPIDVIFISRNFEVLLTAENMKPWRVSPLLISSVYTLETAAGTLKDKVKKGDTVAFEN